MGTNTVVKVSSSKRTAPSEKLFEQLFGPGQNRFPKGEMGDLIANFVRKKYAGDAEAQLELALSFKALLGCISSPTADHVHTITKVLARFSEPSTALSEVRQVFRRIRPTANGFELGEEAKLAMPPQILGGYLESYTRMAQHPQVGAGNFSLCLQSFQDRGDIPSPMQLNAFTDFIKGLALTKFRGAGSEANYDDKKAYLKVEEIFGGQRHVPSGFPYSKLFKRLTGEQFAPQVVKTLLEVQIPIKELSPKAKQEIFSDVVELCVRVDLRDAEKLLKSIGRYSADEQKKIVKAFTKFPTEVPALNGCVAGAIAYLADSNFLDRCNIPAASLIPMTGELIEAVMPLYGTLDRDALRAFCSSVAERYVRHVQHPQNAGTIDRPEHRGEIWKAAAQHFARLNENERYDWKRAFLSLGAQAVSSDLKLLVRGGRVNSSMADFLENYSRKFNAPFFREVKQNLAKIPGIESFNWPGPGRILGILASQVPSKTKSTFISECQTVLSNELVALPNEKKGRLVVAIDFFARRVRPINAISYEVVVKESSKLLKAIGNNAFQTLITNGDTTLIPKRFSTGEFKHFIGMIVQKSKERKAA